MKLEFWSQKPYANAFFCPSLSCDAWQFFIQDHASLCHKAVLGRERTSHLALCHWVELYDTAVSKEGPLFVRFAADSLSGCSNLRASESWVSRCTKAPSGQRWACAVLWGGFHFVGCVQHTFLLIPWVCLPACLYGRMKPGVFESAEHLFRQTNLKIIAAVRIQPSGWTAQAGSSGLPRVPRWQGWSTPLWHHLSGCVWKGWDLNRWPRSGLPWLPGMPSRQMSDLACSFSFKLLSAREKWWK